MGNEARVLPAVDMNDEINKAVQAAVNLDDIKAALIAEAEKQGAAAADQAAKDATARDAAAAVEAEKNAAAGVQTFTRTEVIGGKEFTFEASTEAELDRIALNAYKVAYAVQPTESTRLQTIDAGAAEAAAKAAAEAEIVLKAELEGKYKRGEITIGDYIEQSGALDSYLTRKGISVEELQETVSSSKDKKFEQSWAEATNEFLQGPGADWPGGDRNREMLSMKIAALGLTEAEDKVLALTKAYAEMRRTNMVFANDATAVGAAAAETVTNDATKTTFTAADVKAAAEKAVADAIAAARRQTPVRTASSSSSMFDQSSGTSGAPASTSPNAAADKAAAEAAAKGASPREILDAWNAANIAAGKSPNAAFIETFQARRAS